MWEKFGEDIVFEPWHAGVIYAVIIAIVGFFSEMEGRWKKPNK